MEYKVSGSSRAPSTAWYDPAIVPDIAAWLTERLGPLAWCGAPPEPKAQRRNAIEAMVARGLVLSNPAHAFAVYANILFRTLDGARKAIQRTQAEISLSVMATVPVVAQYQIASAGQKETTAFITSERLATLRAELEAELGELAMFEITSGAAANVEPGGYGAHLDPTALFPPMATQPYVAGSWTIKTNRSSVPVRVMDEPAAPFPEMDGSPISWVSFADRDAPRRVLAGFVTLTAQDSWTPPCLEAPAIS